MEDIKAWASALCAAALLCAAVSMAAPDGKQMKGLKTVLSAMFLCLIISPLSQINNCRNMIDQAVEISGESDSDLMDIIEEQTAEAMKCSVERLVSAELKEMEITFHEISVDMDITSDGCISIGQVTISTGCLDENSVSRVTSSLNEKLGLDAEVICTEVG